MHYFTIGGGTWNIYWYISIKRTELQHSCVRTADWADVSSKNKRINIRAAPLGLQLWLCVLRLWELQAMARKNLLLKCVIRRYWLLYGCQATCCINIAFSWHASQVCVYQLLYNSFKYDSFKQNWLVLPPSP